MNSEVQCIEISNDGSLIAIGKDSILELWSYNLVENEEEKVLNREDVYIK